MDKMEKMESLVSLAKVKYKMPNGEVFGDQKRFYHFYERKSK